MRIKRPSHPIRIPKPTYDELCRESQVAGQQIFDFVGTLLEIWEVTSPTVKARAMQAEKKRIELAKLRKEINKRSLTK